MEPDLEEKDLHVRFDLTASVDLVRRGQGGSKGAVNELFARYIPRLERILRVKIPAGMRGLVEIDDVIQETLMVATRRFQELEVRTPQSVLQWLAKIAEYEIRNRLEYVRAQKRDPARELRLGTDESQTGVPAAALADSAATPSQELARVEAEALVDRELKALEPPDYREVILLRDYYEHDWEEIRSILGRPSVEAVQDLYHRAMKRLRERLARGAD